MNAKGAREWECNQGQWQQIAFGCLAVSLLHHLLVAQKIENTLLRIWVDCQWHHSLSYTHTHTQAQHENKYFTPKSHLAGRVWVGVWLHRKTPHDLISEEQIHTWRAFNPNLSKTLKMGSLGLRSWKKQKDKSLNAQAWWWWWWWYSKCNMYYARSSTAVQSQQSLYLCIKMTWSHVHVLTNKRGSGLLTGTMVAQQQPASVLPRGRANEILTSCLISACKEREDQVILFALSFLFYLVLSFLSFIYTHKALCPTG